MGLTALVSFTWIEMEYCVGSSEFCFLYQIIFHDCEDRDEGEAGEAEEEGDGVDCSSGVCWYAGAGLEVVEHQTVGTCWVREVGTGAGTGLPIPVPAPCQTVVPLVMVVADTPTLEWQELLVSGAALLRQLAATAAAGVFLHLHGSTQSLGDSLCETGRGQEAGDTPGDGLQGEAGVMVVTAGPHTAEHLQVGGSQQGVVPVTSHLHYDPPGGAGVVTVSLKDILHLRVLTANSIRPAA